MNLAIIPARGGSKGVPDKNLLLLPRCIRTAQEALSINHVIVSTNDAAIAKLALDCGAQVIMRPEEISGDEAKSEDALLHVLDSIDYEPDIITFLQCTAALTKPIDIDNCVIELYDDASVDCSFSAASSRYNLWRFKNGEPQPTNHDELKRLPRQLQQGQYVETGACYVMRTKGFKEAKYRFFGKKKMVIMPRSRFFEVDDREDLDDPRLHR